MCRVGLDGETVSHQCHPQLAAEEASNGGQQFQISGCIDVDDVDDVAGEHVVDFDFND